MLDKLTQNENLLLMVLGFQLTVNLPHTVIIKAHGSGLIDKSVGLLAIQVASTIFRNTNLCLQHGPVFLACLSIHLAEKHLESPVINVMLLLVVF